MRKFEMSSICDQLNVSSLKHFEPEKDVPSVDMSGTAIKRHVCDQCGDTYLFESSFINHLQRKSVNIWYSCEHCATKLTFFNRCALLDHIRDHKQTHDTLDTSQLVVTPLSFSTTLQLSNGSKSTENQNKNELLTANKIKKNGHSVCRTDWKCNECFARLDASLKHQHLTQYNQMNGNLLLNACSICPTICPTKCSQTIHNRLHNKHDNPFCPECGNSFENYDLYFIIHIIWKCHHFCRKLVYQCVICSHRESSLSSFEEHIKSFHTKSYYLCSQCRVVFDKNEDLRTHELHSNHHSINSIIYKCPVCSFELNSIKTYFDHILSHQNKFAKFIFTCPHTQCDQSFNSKNELSLHIDHFHGHNKSETNGFNADLIREICIEFKLKIDVNELTEDFSKVNYTEKRNICDLEVNGVKERRSANKTRCSDASKLDNNQTINEKHDIKNSTNDKLFKCNECELRFSVLQTLKRHLILEHSINDVENYINKINLEIPKQNQKSLEPLINEDSEKKLSEILENKNSTESTCPVCLLTFPNVQHLKIHGRVHGMAFIKSCQKKVI